MSVRNLETLPARVPAVFEMPMRGPAYLGAMSMWFTLKPPREKPAMPSSQLTTSKPEYLPKASGMHSSARAVPHSPVQLGRSNPSAGLAAAFHHFGTRMSVA